MKKRFSAAQIIGFLRERETGTPIKDLCCKHGLPKVIRSDTAKSPAAKRSRLGEVAPVR
jgi:hypothetical protein